MVAPRSDKLNCINREGNACKLHSSRLRSLPCRASYWQSSYWQSLDRPESRGSWLNTLRRPDTMDTRNSLAMPMANSTPSSRLTPSLPISNLHRATRAGWWNTWRRSPSSNRPTWRKPAVCCSTSSRTAADINLTGGGFLADARKQGHVLVASGWQGDLEPADGVETLLAPVAKNPDGSSITGRVLARFSDMPRGRDDLAYSSRRRCRDRRSGQPRYLQSHADPPDFGRRRGRPPAQRRLGVRRLQPDSFSRQTRSAEALPEGRVQSRLPVRACVHRQRPESLRHRLRRDARLELVPPLRHPGRYRRRQPSAQADHRDGEPGQLAIWKLPSQLYSSRLQSG